MILLQLLIGKAILQALRLSGRGGGTALPGLVLEKIDPNVGKKLAAYSLSESIIVTGTNGKTTTSRIIREIIKESGQKIIANKAGSNMSRGIVSALLEQSSISNKQKSTGVFEVDEASMPKAVEILQPKLIIVLNLHRDQLDRYGELDTTAKIIGKSLKDSDAQVLLNSDDPLVASLASYVPKERVSFFGFDSVDQTALEHDHAADSLDCPVCGRALDYSKRFYSHIGHYSCPTNDFKRPEPLVKAEFHQDKMRLNDQEINIGLPGLYNSYNALASFNAGKVLGIAPGIAEKIITASSTAFGRIEKLNWGDREATLLLIKNPTGFNQIIQTFLVNKKGAKILFLINDNFADGRDISWLWDAALEELEPHNHTIFTGGLRGHDMALRLKYAGVPAADSGSISESLKKFHANINESDTSYIVATYTAMRKARELLREDTGIRPEYEG